MRRSWLIVSSLLCTVPAMAEPTFDPAYLSQIFDAAYVSKPSVCDRADEEDFSAVLREEQAWAIYPSKGMIDGGRVCYFHDQQISINGAWSPERTAIARCFGGESSIDHIAVAPDSYRINDSVGGNAHGYPIDAFVEVVSMRDESYAGVYTRCEAAESGVLEWFE